LGKTLKILTLIVFSAGLLSCTCATPLKVSEIQVSDKKLSCKEIILEINEAEHYRELAEQERGVSFGNMLMPICWVTSYVDANQAINAAEERIKYLGHIYDVIDCGGKSDSKTKDMPPLIQLQPMHSPVRSMPRQEVKSQASSGQCVGADNIAKYTHQHTDRLGGVYVHCHANNAPHRHIDD
jgi:hypothetical protein